MARPGALLSDDEMNAKAEEIGRALQPIMRGMTLAEALDLMGGLFVSNAQGNGVTKDEAMELLSDIWDGEVWGGQRNLGPMGLDG